LANPINDHALLKVISMADPPRTTETGTSTEAHGARPPRMPGWVKWPAIVLGILILLFLTLRLFGIQHGPGQHVPDGDRPATVVPGGHAPGGGHG
jgi:hypothetical protein